jgi:hypothetical protein
LMLLLLLGQRVWSSVKSGGAKWWLWCNWMHEIGY